MFETLLEKILLSHFGRFLNGLDRTNIHLGLWAGSLMIENVSIRPDLLDYLELPVSLIYSHIEKFQVNIPWSKLSQQPVEILIQNVFVVLTQKAKSKWELSQINKFQYKLDQLSQACKKIRDDINQVKSKKDDIDLKDNQPLPTSVDKQGILDRLIIKVLDNLIVTVQNIHIRYENDLEKPGFSWGITLYKFKSETTDKKYENKLFHDRTDPKNRNQKIFKKMTLERLGFYWNSNELNFFNVLAHEQLKKKMIKFSIYEASANSTKKLSKRVDFVISINCDLKVTINPFHEFKSPEYQVTLHLDPLTLHIRNSQMQDLVKMLDFFGHYQRELTIKTRRTRQNMVSPDLKLFRSINKNNLITIRKNILEERKKTLHQLWLYACNQAILENLKNTFLKSLQKILKFSAKNPKNALSIACLDQEEERIFKKTVEKVAFPQLKKWLQEYLVKKEVVNCNDDRRTKLFFSIFKPRNKLTKAEREQLAQLLEPSKEQLERPDSYVYFSFDLKIDEFALKLSKKLKKFDEGLLFRLTNLQLKLDKRGKGFETKGKILDFAVELFHKYEIETEIKVPILFKSPKSFSVINFLTLDIDKTPLNNANTDLKIKFEIGAIEIRYFPEIMSKFMSYFIVQSEDGVHNVVIDTLQNIDSEKVSIEDLLQGDQFNDVNIKIASPTLVIPLSNYNDPSSPCWVLRLGDAELMSQKNKFDYDLKMNHQESFPISEFHYESPSMITKNFGDDPENKRSPKKKVNESELYDLFDISLRDIQIQYFSSVEFFSSKQRFGDLEELHAFSLLTQETFPVLSDFSIFIKMQSLKSVLSSLRKARFKFSLSFTPLTLNLTPSRVQDLRSLSFLFNNPVSSQSQEFLQTETKILLEKAYKQGWVRRRGKTFGNWTPYYAVFSGGFLYFFLGPRENCFSHYFCVRNAEIRENGQGGVPFSFSLLGEKGGKEMVACSNRSEMRGWMKVIGKKIRDFAVQGLQGGGRGVRKEGEEKQEDSDVPHFIIQATIDKVNVELLDENKKNWVYFVLQYISFSAISTSNEMKIEFMNKIFHSETSKNITLIHSDAKDNALNLKILSKKNADESNINAKIGNFYFKWQPKIFEKLMQFFIKQEDIQFAANEQLFIKRTKYERRQAQGIQIEDLNFIEEKPKKGETSVNLNIGEVSIEFVLPSETSLSLLSFSKINGTLFLGEINSFKGNLLSLSLEDLSSLKPRTLISKLENKIHIDWTGLETSSKLKVGINNLKLFWYHQSIMRAIEFITDGISYVLTKDYSISEATKKDQKHLLKILRKPKFSDMVISLSNISIILRGPSSPDEIMIFIRNIEITNFQEKINERMEKLDNKLINYIWCDNYLIQIQNGTFYFRKDFDGQNRIALSFPLNFNILIQKITLEEEYNLLFGEASSMIDKTMRIRMEFEPIQLKLLKSHFDLFMDVMLNNIAADDGKDTLLKLSYFPNAKSKPLDVILDCQSLRMAFCDNFPEINKYYNVLRFPLCEFVFWDWRMRYNREQSKAIVNLWAQKLQGDSYEYTDDLHESFIVTINGLIEELRSETMSLQNFLKIKKSTTMIKKSFSEGGKESFLNNCKSYIYDENAAKFKMEVLMPAAQKQKYVDIIMNQMLLLVNLSFIENLRNFTNFKDTQSTPTTNPSKLSFSLSINNMLLCIQGPSENQLIGIQAQLFMNMKRNMDKLHNSSHKLSENPKRDFKSSKMRTFMYIPFESSETMDVEIKGMELFNCSKKGLLSGKDLKKRNFIKPTDFAYRTRSFFCFCHSYPRKISFVEMSLGKTQAHLSFRDIIVLYETLLFQGEDRKKARNFEQRSFDASDSSSSSESEKSDYSIESEIPLNSLETNLPLTLEETKSYSIQNLELMLIDDIEEALVPLFYIEIRTEKYDIESLFYLNKTKEMLKSIMVLSFSFYNPFVGKIEPVLEPTKLAFCQIVNLEANPKKIISVELIGKNANVLEKLDEDDEIKLESENGLQINVSEEMVNILVKTYLGWERELKNFKEELQTSFKKVVHNAPLKSGSKNKKHKNAIIKSYFSENKIVSIYNLTNLSGYTLSILENKSDKAPITLIEGATMNFEVNCENDDLERLFHDSRKISIKFEDLLGKTYFLENIELNRFRTNLLFWKSRDDDKNKRKYFLIEVQVSETRKSLSILSNTMIQNDTNRKINIFLKKGKQIFKREILEKQCRYIPVDFLDDGYISFNLNEEKNQYFKEYSLKQIMKLDDSSYIEIEDSGYSCFLRRKKVENENNEWKYMFILEAIFSLVNCIPLEIQVAVQKNINSQEKSKFQKLVPDEKLEVFEMTVDSLLYLKIIIDGYYESPPIPIYNGKSDREICDSVNLKSVYNYQPNSKRMNNSSDTNISEIYCEEDNLTTIFLARSQDFEFKKEIYLYVSGCLINETNQNLSFYSLDKTLKKRFHLNVDDPALPILYNCQPFLSIGLDENNISNEISIENAGNYSLEIKRRNNHVNCELHEFGINLEMRTSVKPLFILTKFVEIQPKYVVINKSPYTIEITQYNSIFGSFLILPEQRIPFFWPDCTKEKLIAVRTISTNERKSSYSGAIEIASLESVDFLIPSLNLKDPLIFKLSLKKFKSTFFITFLLQTPDNCTYLLQNNTKNFLIKYSQNINLDDNPEFILLKGTNKVFGWPFPNLKKELIFSLQHMNEKLTEERKFVVDINSIIFEKILRVQTLTGRNIIISLKMEINESTRLLVFTDEDFERKEDEIDIPDQIMISGKLSSVIAYRKEHFGLRQTMVNNEEEKYEDSSLMEEKQIIDKIIYLNFNNIGFSLIGKNNGNPIELAYIRFLNTEVVVMDENEFKTIHFRTKFLNIDNNTFYDLSNPVFFTPTFKKKILRDKNKYFLEIFFKYNQKSKNIVCIESFKLLLESVTIKLDDIFVNLFMNWVNSIMKSLKLFENGKDENKKEKFSWKKIDIQEESKFFYIKEIVLPDFHIQLSFLRKIVNSSTKNFFFFNSFSNALGKTITNIEDAPIELAGLKIQKLFGSKEQIIARLKDHYMEFVIPSALKILGSIKIIGNPVGFCNYLKIGFQDLIDKPREGLIEGPLQSCFGLLIGAGSLIKQTFAGTCNSLQNISGSFAIGLTLLSFDNSFIDNSRRMNIMKPQNLIEGIDQGLKSIYNGIEDGITGVFKQPFEGYKSEGISGFFKGSCSGMTGLFIKPISGVCEATSIVAEGLKNTATLFDDKPNSTRLRLIRAFYEKEGYFKIYSSKDAEILTYLQTFNKGKYRSNKLLESLIIRDGKDYLLILIMIENIIAVSKNKQKIEWKAKAKNIKKIDVVKKENEKYWVVIHLKKMNKLRKTICFELPAGEPPSYFLSKFNSLIEDVDTN